MRTKLAALLILLLGVPTLVFGQLYSSSGGGNISQLEQWTSTTTPSNAITQRSFGKDIKITGLTASSLLCLDANNILDTSCGSVSSFSSLTVGALIATTSLTASYTGANMLLSTNALGVLVSTSTPTAARYIATSSLASLLPYASTTAVTVSGTLYNSSLTSGRVPYISIGGAFTDSANLTYNGTTLTVGANVSLSGTGTTTITNLVANYLEVPIFATSFSRVFGPAYTATTSASSVFPFASTTSITSSGISDFGGVKIGTLDGLLYGNGGLVDSTATTSLTASSPLSLSQPISVIGSAASTLSLNTSGTWSGNAGTASALAADPTDCGANTWANAIATTGNLTCSAVTYAGITAMTSANFFGLITDETGGSGVVVGSASPTLTGLTTMTYASTTMLTSSQGATFATVSGSVVGIGTTNPDQKLVVIGDIGIKSGNGLYLWNYSNDNYSRIWSPIASPNSILQFDTGNKAEAMYINTTGNVGIGTTSPASLLHVSAGATATTTVEFGGQSIQAKTCFNVRDALGAATSFYFVGTAMVVEANRCR